MFMRAAGRGMVWCAFLAWLASSSTTGCVSHPHAASNAVSASSAGAERAGSTLYTPSSLTPWADRLTAVGIAAVDGAPLPAHGMPVDDTLGTAAGRVHVHGADHVPSSLSPAAVLIRLVATVAPGAAPSPAVKSKIVMTLWLDAKALRLVQLEARAPSADLGGVEIASGGPVAAAQEALASLHAGGAGAIALGPPAASVEGAREGRVAVPAVLRASLQSLWQTSAASLLTMRAAPPVEIERVAIDGAAVLARSSTSRWWLLEMSFREGDHGPVVRGSPVVNLYLLGERAVSVAGAR